MTSNKGYAHAIVQVLLLVWIVAPAYAAQSSTGSVRGRVKEHNGKWLAGVAVRAVSAKDESSAFETTTDGKGDFELRGLASGDYTLTFARQGYRTFTSRKLSVEAGETVKLSRAIELAPEREPYAVIRGAIFTDEGFSLPNARVMIERVGEGKRFRRETMSHEGGEFAFRLPADKGLYRITASARGFQTASREIEVDSDDVRQVALSLERVK